MTSIVRLGDKLRVFAQAIIPSEDREVAWDAARDLMQIRPDIGWVMGNFVQSDVSNLNGHLFPLADLQETYKGLINTPLNMLHQSQHTVGAFIATEMLYPTDSDIETPYTEALASFWRLNYPSEWQQTMDAHKNGSLALSMEAIPASLTCPQCSLTAEYDGPTSGTYCAHMNKPGGQKQLNKPHFVGGAIVIPPAKPGWAKASVKELASHVDAHTDEADALIAAFKDVAPHLSNIEWENMMLAVMETDLPSTTSVEPDEYWNDSPVRRHVGDGHQTGDANISFVIDLTDPSGHSDTSVTVLNIGSESDTRLTWSSATRLLNAVGKSFTQFTVTVSAGAVAPGSAAAEEVYGVCSDSAELEDLSVALYDALIFEGLIDGPLVQDWTLHPQLDSYATSYNAYGITLLWGSASAYVPFMAPNSNVED